MRVVQLVRRTNPESGLVGASESRRGNPPSGLLTTARLHRHPPFDTSHRGQLRAHLRRISRQCGCSSMLPRRTIANAILNYIVKNPGNHGPFVAPIPRKNDSDIRGMGEVGKLRSLAHLPVVMLGSKRRMRG